ncbi:MAG: hypothetical protein V4501_07695 [Pseudomonadota bacterium]
MKFYIFQSLNNLTLKIEPVNSQNQTTVTLIPESFCIQLPGKTLLDKTPMLTRPRYLSHEIETSDDDYDMDDDLPGDLEFPLYQPEYDLPSEQKVKHYRGDGTYFDDLSIRDILKIPLESDFSEISLAASFTELDNACPSNTFMIGLAINSAMGHELLFVAKSREDVKELLDLHAHQASNELKDYQDWTWRYTSNPEVLIENLLERLNSKYALDKVLFLDKTGIALNNSSSESLIAIVENKNANERKLIETKVACPPDAKVIEDEKMPVTVNANLNPIVIKIFSACSLGKLDMFAMALAEIADKDKKIDVLKNVKTKIDNLKFLPHKQKILKNFNAFCSLLIPAETSMAPSFDIKPSNQRCP